MTFKHITFIAFTLVFVSSCTVKKRRYTKGYHVEWNTSISKKRSTSSPSISEIELVQPDNKKKKLTTKSSNREQKVKLTLSKERHFEMKKVTKTIEKTFGSLPYIVTQHSKPISKKVTKNNTQLKLSSKTDSSENNNFFLGLLIVLAVIALLVGLSGVIAFSAQETVIYIIVAVIFIALALFLEWLGAGDLFFLALDIISFF